MSALRQAPIGRITDTHLAHLDGLRGMAILLVMVYHFCLPHNKFHGQDAGPLLQLAQSGWMGVDLFFVLSGFLITGILSETREQPHYFRNFLWRRFLRIWPLYYVSLLALLVLLPSVMSHVPAALKSMQDKQLWFWLYGANWLYAAEGGFNQTSGGYFWSLAVEEQFYLVWPFIVYALSPRALLRTSIALLVTSLLLRIVLPTVGVQIGSLYTITFTHLDGLAVGSALAICARSGIAFGRVARAAPYVAVAALLVLAATRLIDGNLFFWSRTMAIYGYSAIALLGGCLLVSVLAGHSMLGFRRLLTTRFMRAAGQYSYALYMVHVPIAGVMFQAVAALLGRAQVNLPHDAVILLSALMSFAASWIAAVASWHLFEKRILALKRHFSYSSTTSATRSPAPQQQSLQAGSG